MPATVSGSLLAALEQLTDPRHRRGVRHPFPGLLALTLLGLLCRQADFLSIARWAADHWEQLREPLGFTRDYAPHNTTLSRACARFSLAEFQHAWWGWLLTVVDPATPLTVAVDGKTSKQAHDTAGDPLHVLNVFVHDLKVCLGQWKVGDGKDTEPAVLKAHLAELFAAYPALDLLTGDALFAQRPLAELIIAQGKHYLVALKENQPDLLEVAQATFAHETPATADAGTREKKGARWSHAGSGPTPTRRRTPAPR